MKLNIDKKAVGSRIRTIRLDRGLTLDEFGKILDTTKSNIQFWEKGTNLPNSNRIILICKIANLTRNELLYGSIDELIENNKELICKEYRCNKYDLLTLQDYKDYEKYISEIDINLEDTKLLKSIFNVFDKMKENLKEDFIITFNKVKILNLENDFFKKMDDFYYCFNNKEKSFNKIDVFLHELEKNKDHFTISDLDYNKSYLEDLLNDFQFLEIRRLQKLSNENTKKILNEIENKTLERVKNNKKLEDIIVKAFGIDEFIEKIIDDVFDEILKQLENEEKDE